MSQINIMIILLIVALLAIIGTIGLPANSQVDNESQDEQPQQSQDDEQSQVTWKTFRDRDNLFTVQYLSNWTAQGFEESLRAGPIDILFLSPGATLGTGVEVEFLQYGAPSVYQTARDALNALMTTYRYDPTATKFEIERPLECQTYTLNGLPACSVIYEVQFPDVPGTVGMVIGALAPNGTEYQVTYKSDFESFQHFLPTFESMVKSFRTTGSEKIQTTGNGSAVTDFSDFSLEDGGIGGSNATTDSVRNTTGSTSTNSSRNDDFSLGD